MALLIQTKDGYERMKDYLERNHYIYSVSYSPSGWLFRIN